MRCAALRHKPAHWPLGGYDNIGRNKLPVWQAESDGQHDRGVITRSHVRLHDAALRPIRQGLRREHIVETPPDVAGPQISPRRPPREQIRIVRIERASDIDEMAAEQRLEQRAFLGALADRVRLALFGMHIHLGPGNVHVAAEDDVASFGMKPAGPFCELFYGREPWSISLSAGWDGDGRGH